MELWRCLWSSRPHERVASTVKRMNGNASASRSGLILAFSHQSNLRPSQAAAKTIIILSRWIGVMGQADGPSGFTSATLGGFNSVGGSPPILRYAHNTHPPPPHRIRGNQIAASGDLVTPRMGGVSHKFSSLAIASGLKDIGYVEGVCECLRECEWLHAIIQVSRRLGLWPKNEGREGGRPPVSGRG